MARLNKEQLQKVKDMYGVDRIWSFSRLNKFHTCPWDYWATYIEHLDIDSSSEYTFWGTKSHDLIQDELGGKIKYEDMIDVWEKEVEEWENDPNGYKFDNKKIKDGYINNLTHYFTFTQVPENTQKLVNEKPVKVVVGNQPHVFVGYIDTEYIDEEGNLVLVDYKTSSKSGFSKAKLPEKSMQLKLYAIGEHQRTGLPYEKIKARFDMMKYCVVHYQQENGKWKESVQERSEWVYKMNNKLKTKLPKLGYDPIETDELIIKASQENSMKCLPQEVQDQFYITNYYIEIDINEEDLEELEQDIANQCDAILEFEKQDDLESYLEVNYPYDPNNYYDKKLCGYHTSKYFKGENAEEDDLDVLFGTNDEPISQEEDDLMKMIFG